MNGAAAPSAPQDFEWDVLARIPLAAAMRLRVAEQDPGRLVLAAPLASNLNHEGIAFGGAIECLGTLACWGLLWLTLAEPDAMIVIQHGETDFMVPITSELRAEACLPEPERWQRFVRSFEHHGRGRIELAAVVGDADRPASAHFRGRFVATRKSRR